METIFGFNRPYVRNIGKVFTPMYLAGERYSFYINFADIPMSESFNHSLYLIDAQTNEQVEFIIGLQSLYVVTPNIAYHLYSTFVFPYVEDGQYYLQVWDNTTKSERCRSNLIIVDSNVLYNTSYCQFQHNDILFGVRYDLLPANFFQRFRLTINVIKAPDIVSTREEYRQSSGQRDLRITKSFRDISLTYEMYFAGQEDYEALSAMLEHSNIIINGRQLTNVKQVKVEEVSPFNGLYKGTFTAIPKYSIAGGVYSADFLARGF